MTSCFLPFTQDSPKTEFNIKRKNLLTGEIFPVRVAPLIRRKENNYESVASLEIISTFLKLYVSTDMLTSCL